MLMLSSKHQEPPALSMDAGVKAVAGYYKQNPDAAHHLQLALRIARLQRAEPLKAFLGYTASGPHGLVVLQGNDAFATATADEISASADALIVHLPEQGCRLQAAEPLAEAIASVWNRQSSHYVTFGAVEQHLSRELTQPQPYVEGSLLSRNFNRATAACFMASCWNDQLLMAQEGQAPVKPQDMEQLLQLSNAVFYAGEAPTSIRAFMVFTQLSKRHLLLGSSCGDAAVLPLMAPALAGLVSAAATPQRPVHLSALVNTKNTPLQQRLERDGFSPTANNLRFLTLNLC